MSNFDIRIVDYAREKGKKVKVVGFGHSPSDIACTTDFMISLKRYNKVLKVDEEKSQVSVQAGCLIKDLNHNVLPAHNLAFSVQGTVDDLSAAGVISTGTHGTGTNFGIVSSYVVDLTLMKASGEIITISKEENSELFNAAVLGLGSLGVILSVTFQCEKAYRLHQRQFPSSLKNVIDNFDKHVAEADHFRFMWYPHTESVVCYSASRTKKEPAVKSSWFWDMFVGYHLLQLLLWISTFVPCLVKSINRLYFRLMCQQPIEKVARSDRVFNFNCLFKQYVTEWAIPKENTGVVLYKLKDWIEQNGFYAHFPVEVRFVRADDIYLSPCYQQDSCYINIIMYRPFNKLVDHESYWTAYESIMAEHGGRPHWAKAHKYTGLQFQKIYPKWKEFCAIREKLDPNGMFLNANLERVFDARPSPSTYV
ncbi:L-gulonolactone oxidase isoform X2 [Aplysia californica]|uniref:L-gulonolactone oxidase n=1 Tax=Aplysia californica TaxID=6500 RepID=A0ABM1VXE9_APLCA|nr:L-gulonolactone oxidase isoform X2 [Aplysia californica]